MLFFYRNSWLKTVGKIISRSATAFPAVFTAVFFLFFLSRLFFCHGAKIFCTFVCTIRKREKKTEKRTKRITFLKAQRHKIEQQTKTAHYILVYLQVHLSFHYVNTLSSHYEGSSSSGFSLCFSGA